MAELSEQIEDLHIRVGKVEEEVFGITALKEPSPVWMQALAVIGAFLTSYLGLFIPNHPYQYIFAILLIGWLYHRKTIEQPTTIHAWVFAAINVFTAAMIFKLLIGGGTPQPLSWIKVPVIEGGVTSFNLEWQQISLSNLEIPLTVIQSYLLVLVFLGGFSGFTVFSSLLAVMLVILSVPALVDFNWDWVLPAVILFSLSIYFQAGRRE